MISSKKMPPDKPLSITEIEAIEVWINQEAVWDASTPGSMGLSTLTLRRPDLPQNGEAHPIDAFVDSYFQKHRMAAPAPVSDEVFVRRAYLDLWGLLPTPEQWRNFIKGERVDKRAHLIEQLLANRENYSEHWISYWNDLLHNDEGVKYPAGTRESITNWLLEALRKNTPYDQMVRSLLNPVKENDPAGFLVGVNWGGDVSASQTPPMQASQNSTQVFLGANLKCASCHDSFVSRWKLRDTYGLASFFSEGPLEIVRCDVETGEIAPLQFLFPDLANGDTAESLTDRRALVARLFTTPRNGRFARTMVNRIWKKSFGRGLVEPADDMDAQPWDSDLLDWMASDFVDHDYDLQQLLKRIMTSRAYQLPAVDRSVEADKKAAYVFRGPFRRRLSAEQFIDGVSSITGEWRILDDEKGNAGTYSRDWQLKSGMLTRALGRPIRDKVVTDRKADATTLQVLELINGNELATLLHRGAKRMTHELKPPPANLFDSGVVKDGKVPFDFDISAVRELRLIIADAGSYDPAAVVAGWSEAELVGPNGVTRLGDYSSSPGAEKKLMQIKGEEPKEALVTLLPSELIFDIADQGFTRFRGVVGVDEGSLLYQITPKVRFFVFSEEPDRLQLVRVAEDPPVPSREERLRGDALIETLYRYAVARNPTPEERRIAGQFLDGAGSDGLEDLLWAIFLSPEFQFIR